jgi:hypothetical protein
VPCGASFGEKLHRSTGWKMVFTVRLRFLVDSCKSLLLNDFRCSIGSEPPVQPTASEADEFLEYLRNLQPMRDLPISNPAVCLDSDHILAFTYVRLHGLRRSLYTGFDKPKLAWREGR